jgi:endoglucanase
MVQASQHERDTHAARAGLTHNEQARHAVPYTSGSERHVLRAERINERRDQSDSEDVVEAAFTDQHKDSQDQASQDSVPENTPAHEPAPAENNTPPAITSNSPGNPLSGMRLFVNPNSFPARQADIWASSRPRDAESMRRMAELPESIWIGDWVGNIHAHIDQVYRDHNAQGAVPVLVLYNIPQRDCGYHSEGGVPAHEYRAWVRDLASAIGNREAVIILEPDGIPLLQCLATRDQQTRLDLLRDAVEVLKAQPNTHVYIDAGHSHTISADETASRLHQAGILAADGFALNVSNYRTTQENISFGERLSPLVGDKHFVIDTSRNGNGQHPNDEWCNPSGRALGPPEFDRRLRIIGQLAVERGGRRHAVQGLYAETRSSAPSTNARPGVAHWFSGGNNAQRITTRDRCSSRLRPAPAPRVA